ncbi:MAG: hypothetical protein EXQ56_04555 [Acidobacteria bacterium]|nr:hypothetical protein [Acidobacteriota bacterium]
MAENNNGYVTKADLKAELIVQRDEMIAAMNEAIHDTETRLLTAFYGFGESIQKRTVIVENAQGGLTGLLATLDRRVTELEKKVNFPNAS